jgi:hypothetical protein
MGVTSRLAVLFAAAMLAGCSGGDDGSFTLVMDFAFYETPVSGTFTVSEGSNALGCSRGTFVDKTEFAPVPRMTEELTCTDGGRTGSFIIRVLPAHPASQPNEADPEVETGTATDTDPEPIETRWRFDGGTGDFTGLEGEGDLILELNGNEFSGVGTVTGNVVF